MERWTTRKVYIKKKKKKNYNEVICHYCEEKGHIQSQCATLREGLKCLKQLKGKVHVAESSDDGDLYHVESADNDSVQNHSRWVLDSTVQRSSHVYYFAERWRIWLYQLGKKLKLKVEGIGRFLLKLHNGKV